MAPRCRLRADAGRDEHRVLLADGISPPIHAHRLVAAWQTDWMSLVALAIELGLAGLYVVGTVRLARRGRRWSPWRTASFLGGTAAVVVAVQSGLASYDDSVFQAHVVQHLLLMNVAPILYALAAPVTLALQAAHRPAQRRALRVLNSRAVAFVTHPVVVVVNFYVTMLVFFVTPLYQFSLEHPLVHELTHLHFLVSGLLFWWLVVGIDPSHWRLSSPVKLGALAAGVPVSAILGLALTQGRTSIAPQFHTVADTHAGGALLWIVGECFTLGAMMIIVAQWMRTDGREAIRADRRLDARARASASRRAGTDPATGSGTGPDTGPGSGGEPGDDLPVPDGAVFAVRVEDGRLVAAEPEGPG